MTDKKEIIFSLLLVIFKFNSFFLYHIYNQKENLALLLNIVVHATLWNKFEISYVNLQGPLVLSSASLE